MRYPWNTSPLGKSGRPERTPDDRALRFLARAYASTHPSMALDDPRGRFPDAGTVNGAEWYESRCVARVSVTEEEYQRNTIVTGTLATDRCKTGCTTEPDRCTWTCC